MVEPKCQWSTDLPLECRVHDANVIEVPVVTKHRSESVRRQRGRCRNSTLPNVLHAALQAKYLDGRQAGVAPRIVAEGVKLLNHAKYPTAVYKAITALEATDATKACWSNH